MDLEDIKSDFEEVTFDADFIDINAMHGTPPKIVYPNTGNLTTKNITELLMDNILRINHYLDAKSNDILELIKAPSADRLICKWNSKELLLLMFVRLSLQSLAGSYDQFNEMTNSKY